MSNDAHPQWLRDRDERLMRKWRNERWDVCYEGFMGFCLLLTSIGVVVAIIYAVLWGLP